MRRKPTGRTPFHRPGTDPYCLECGDPCAAERAVACFRPSV